MLLLLDARQRQEIVDQPRHAPALLAHDGKESVARLRVVARRALQGLDEAEQRGERRAQFVAGVGDEVDAHPLDAARLGQIAQGQQRRDDLAAVGGERRDGDLEQPLDRHALAPQRRLALRRSPSPRRTRVDDVGRAQASTSGSPILSAGNSSSAGALAAAARSSALDDDRGLRHGADELAPQTRRTSRRVAAKLLAAPFVGREDCSWLATC